MGKKIGVVLAGCGVKDGSEIHEAVLTLLAIDQNRCKAVCMAPNSTFNEVDHLSMKETGAERNVLVESARIARGNIRDIATVSEEELDALIIPGGHGAAKNLCTFGKEGASATIHPEVLRLLRAMAKAGKPIGAICIAPALLAVTLGRELSPMVTIGSDPATAEAINATGSTHVNCLVTDFVVDRRNKIVTTPAYMLAESISEAHEGIIKTVKTLIELM